MRNLEREVAELSKRVERLEKSVLGNVAIPRSSVADAVIDAGDLHYLRELRSAPDKCLAILDHASRKDAGHSGFAPDELVAILRQQFGLPVPLSTISSQLYAKTGRYVTRDLISRRPLKYRYRILPKGQDYIRTKVETLKGQGLPRAPENAVPTTY
jgi:hypothetical protein